MNLIFASLKKLKNMDLSFCKLKEAQKYELNFFESLKNLKNMDLFFCKLKKAQKT